MSSEATQFVDEYYNVHERGKELGSGGQGVVFRTRDPDVAVKVALDGEGRPVVLAGYVEQLRRVRALPVPEGLNLAAPMAVLQDTAGYAMRLLNNMVPFSDFWPDARPVAVSGLPGWLRAAPAELAGQLLWYCDTGSLHRRLMALYRCATVLARLHGAGLVYGDVSPSNAFVARDLASREVWLIDADNLRYETAAAGRAIFTPRFGAPELVRGIDGGRPRTDGHAFAVMAFWMLTLMHPFIGAYVEAGADGDWADDDGASGDPDERAYAGLVPWILDEDDDRNHKDNGLVQQVLTAELRTLFQATFGPGRTRPWMRPSMFTWAVGLARAVDSAITCPACRMGYHVDLADDGQRCPFCDGARPRLLVVDAYDWTGRPIGSESPAWRLACVFGAGSAATALPHRLFHPFSPTDGDRDFLEVSEDGVELRLACCDVGRRQNLAVACDEPGHDLFPELEGMAVLPLPAVIARGLWLRVGGPAPRMLHCLLRGGAR